MHNPILILLGFAMIAAVIISGIVLYREASKLEAEILEEENNAAQEADNERDEEQTEAGETDDSADRDDEI